MERYRTTIILIVLLAGLAGAVFFLQSPDPNAATNATPTPTANMFGAGNTDQITALDVVSGTQRVSLRQEISGATWALLEPVKAEAEGFAVNNIADQLKTLHPIETITQTTDLDQYGLGKPRLSITVKFADASQTEKKLLIGNTTPDMAYYYAKLDGTQFPYVYIISNGVVAPIIAWLEVPPIAQPTPTPVPQVVLSPEPSPTPTLAPSPTP